ncbi:MAG: ABC transporter permease [Gammaproteobacteria bacterium]|nr:ABC transporter permease [Gammaproteobacteria bacterium]
MKPLDRKLWRDLRRLWLQALAVGLVLGSGIALFVMSTGMYGSLERARDRYYAHERMADLASSLVRAPDRVARDLAALPGIDAVEARVTGIGLISLPDVVEPVSARLLSLPSDRRPRVNDLVLRVGAWPDPRRDDEILVNEAFAEAHGLAPGAPLDMLLRGKRRVLRLAPGASARAVSAEVDRLLAPHGGRGAYGRDRMLSARYLSDELSQLRTMASVLPPVFLLVAVFLINVTLSRLVATERANIGLLKAFGYRNGAIALHYAEFALVFCAFAALLGVVLGGFVGGYMADIYRAVYRLPVLEFEAGAATWLGALGVALLAAVLGAAGAVARAVRLPPATALSPPAPTHFGRLGAGAERAAQRLDARARMLVRRIVRFPRRSATTVAGIAFALALLILSDNFPAVVDRIIDVNFGVAQRMDVSVTFAERQHERVLRELARLPGVEAVEPLRTAEVILSAGPRRQRDALMGVPEGAWLNRIIGEDERPVQPRADGVTLSEGLAGKLGVGVGDRVRIEATDGRRVVSEVPVVALIKPFIGGAAYMDQRALGRLLREPERIDSAYLRIDPAERDALAKRLKGIPAIVGVTFADNAEASLRAMFDQGTGFFAFMFLAFSLVMAAGVAFSAARVTLGEQERDLATLRVLGFRRSEASWVLLGELGLLLAVAIPIGLVLGFALSQWLMSEFETEIFSFPFVFDPPTYARAVLFVVVAVVAAALWVRRDVDRLDLVAVLKSRE